MLSLLELKYHCQTCLIKIEGGVADREDKCIPIGKYEKLEKFIQKCLGISNASDDDDHRRNVYMPHLCSICLEKWMNFSSHCRLAIKNYETLRKILKQDKSCEVDYESNKIFLEAETNDVENCEVEKYETISPFYPTSKCNAPAAALHRENSEEESISDLEASCLHEIENEKSLQSPNISSLEENCLLKEAREALPEKSAAVKKHSKEKQRISCRSKRKTKTETETEEITTNDLNDTNNENNIRKAAFRCKPCKKFFYSSITYEGHIKRVHEGVKKAFQCKECDKAYSYAHNLADHIDSCHRKLPGSERELPNFQCKHCKKPYKSKASLTQHIRNHHRDCDAESKRVICDQCGFLAAHHISLLQHIKNKHTETEEIKCGECEKTFKSQYYLKYHMLSFHNPMNIRPFKCPQCPRAFTRRARMNIHIRTHLTYAERIKCDFEGCDVRFIKLSSKRRHMRLVHLKVKQHVCDICGEAFGIKATLTHHRYIHTGEKPYNCNLCGQAFRQLTAMKTHRKTHAAKGAGAGAGAVIRKDSNNIETDCLRSLTDNIDGGFEDSSNDFE